MPSDGSPTYFAADLAYLENKLERGFERLITAARRRPPRLRAALQGGAGGARRRPGPARDPAAPVRAHRRARRARVDVQAARRVHHARRPDRPDRRRRRRATSCSSARTTRRSTSTSTWRARSRPRTRSTTSSTRTRGSPRSCARPGERAAGGPATCSLAPRRAGADQEAARLPGRGGGGGRPPRAAPDRRLRARAGRRPSRRSTATARWSAPSPRRSSRSGSGCAWRPSARSPARSLAGRWRRVVGRPSRCRRIRRPQMPLHLVEEVQPEAVERLLGLDVERVSSPVNSRTPMAIRTAPERAVMIR